eukprot:jgi/Botrbrau1/14834/Bobra.0278s0004.1
MTVFCTRETLSRCPCRIGGPISFHEVGRNIRTRLSIEIEMTAKIVKSIEKQYVTVASCCPLWRDCQ